MTVTSTPIVVRTEWFTPLRCRWTLAAILLAGFLGHLFYLIHNCPIDLSGDEAPRHRDLGHLRQIVGGERREYRHALQEGDRFFAGGCHV